MTKALAIACLTLIVTGVVVDPLRAQSLEIRPAPRQGGSGSGQKDRGSEDEKSAAGMQSTVVWYVIEFDGKRVGYESLTTTRSANDDKASGTTTVEQLIQRLRTTQLRLRRFGTDVSVSARLETQESPEGVLQFWRLQRTAADGTSMERTGQWNADRGYYDVTEATGTTTRQDQLPTDAKPVSPILNGWVPEVTARRTRGFSSSVLFPETAAVASMRFQIAPAQSLILPDDRRIRVTKIEYWPEGSPDLKSSMYVNETQEVVLMEQPLLGETLRLIRTDSATALGQQDQESLDLQFRSGIPLRRTLSIQSTSTSIQLVLTSVAGKLLTLSESEFQTVERGASGELFITLKKPALPEDSTSGGADRRTQKKRIPEEYLAASSWIDWNDTRIQRKGIIVAGAATDPYDKCRRLVRHVWKEMRFSPFSTSLTPASGVAEAMQGDCTEHAVLLCALLRSQQIPARTVTGFVYVADPPLFAPHMWVEAQIGSTWLPLDSTRGPDGVGLTHLRVADSALTDDVASGTQLFIPLLDFLGTSKIDVAPDTLTPK